MALTVTNPGFVSLFQSNSKQPLANWDKKIRSGYIKKVRDEDLCTQVLELNASRFGGTYISCPSVPSQILGIKNHVLNVTVKNLNRYFALDLQILDDKGVKRRFRATNQINTAKIKPFYCQLPLFLEDGWNQITVPLQDFTMRCYGTNHVQTLRLQVHASCRLRRIFFSNKICLEQDLPQELRLNHMTTPKKILPKVSKKKKVNEKKK